MFNPKSKKMKKLFTLVSALGLSAFTFAQTPLFNTAQLVTHPGAGAGGANVSALQQTVGLSSFGSGNQQNLNNWVAEKFTVTGAGWIVDSLVTYGYQTSSGLSSTFTGLYAFISADSSGLPDYTPTIGNRTTSSLGSTNGFSGIYRALESSLTDVARPLMRMKSTINGTLTAGTYWAVWAATGSGASGPWCPPRTILNTATTGNAMQFLGSSSSWTAVVSGTASATQGMPVTIYGKFVSGVNEAAVSANNISISPSPMVSSANVNITLAENSGISESDLSFVMMDVTGKEVMNNSNITSNSFAIERGDLAAGTYLYKLVNKSNGNTVNSGKLVIQ